MVVLAAHHAVDALTAGGGVFGQTQIDALVPDTWRSFLSSYPNVLFFMVGHSHRNRVVP